MTGIGEATKRSAIEVTSYLTITLYLILRLFPSPTSCPKPAAKQDCDNVVLNAKLIACGEVANLAPSKPRS